jgi:transcriptional regulator with XRE-family HTH domain
MDSKIAHDERVNFSSRLKKALADYGLAVSPVDFTRAYNARADGSAVSVHAARKWLSGEAIPTHEKIVILSIWLRVSAAWLRFGDADIALATTDVISEAEISTPTLSLINDIRSLPVRDQRTIRAIVDAFLRTNGRAADSPAND